MSSTEEREGSQDILAQEPLSTAHSVQTVNNSWAETSCNDYFPVSSGLLPHGEGQVGLE